ncbi:caltractin-like [Galendromus occidentalis]|uniref:Caltractin-like n=1 Tax=Galendromus occidentalis TaxID=34638 RepID=A0AAJ7SFU2_9ACAR|nr:caltractin-like [Galendromus occidentalis]
MTETPDELREAFRPFDTGDGCILSKNLKFAMRALGFEPRKEEVRKILSDLGKNDMQQDKVSFDEFVSIMSARVGDDPTDETLKAFKLFDDDNTGKISLENLKRVAQELEADISVDELQQMIEEADKDGDGEVNQQEFMRIMKRTCLY